MNQTEYRFEDGFCNFIDCYDIPYASIVFLIATAVGTLATILIFKYRNTDHKK